MAKEAMKTLIALQHPFLYLPKPIPSTQRISLLPHETANKNPNFNRMRARKLQAKAAKGFGGAPATKSKRKADSDEEGEDEDEKLPEDVWNRITRRILFYVGAPMATGLVLVQILGTVKERGIWDVPNWVPILTIFVFLSASTLGVAYGALSASWVSDREGSALGFEEAQRNWAEMWREDDDQNK
ncbi:uncharacterized protein PAM68-like [Ipomoea triloba]|uniref:uncharacterized protein PAM68-like n=1 Tax=Ipomoea triloba TaxID=35885 RepID=UPI00125E92C0|nr:uncharacterized protein PAM68-like [Ipomoea triloba]